MNRQKHNTYCKTRVAFLPVSSARGIGRRSRPTCGAHTAVRRYGRGRYCAGSPRPAWSLRSLRLFAAFAL